jgi:hypothetical protein
MILNTCLGGGKTGYIEHLIGVSFLGYMVYSPPLVERVVQPHHL